MILPMKHSLVSIATFATPLSGTWAAGFGARGGAGGGVANNMHCLYQRDFVQGTKTITKPGSYKLCEDITFAPGKPSLIASDEEIANAFDPVTVGGEYYNTNEYSLGYFAALVIAANNVTLHLNGFTIQQDPSHALLQRFFAVIELSSAPFIPNAGPAQFVSDTFVSAKDFVLQGPGTIGRSSHHGIHGNDNERIVISNVDFRDFEVAAVALNNVKGLSIKNCYIPHNRHDVPVLGSFSAARQILPYIKALKENSSFAGPYSMLLRGAMTSSADVYHALVKSIANVYRDVMETGFISESDHPDEFKLFNNPHHIVDGVAYAFLVHGKGPAVGGQGFELSADETLVSRDVEISNNIIENIKCFINEVPAVVEGGVVQNDARGGILQLISTQTNEWLASDVDFHYTGNVVVDAQIMVAKAIHDGALTSNKILQTGVNTISPMLVDWAMSGTAQYIPRFRCNGDR